MNRKDLIIIAVLMNAGLLVTLFLTALKQDNSPSLLPPQIAQQEQKGEPFPPLLQDSSLQVKEVKQGMEQPTIEEKKESPLVSPMRSVLKKEEEKWLPSSPPLKAPFRIVSVEKGDVLEKIARTHGVSVDEIMKLNHLTDSRLQIGQELKVPEKESPSKESGKKKQEEGVYYVVKGGDSPWTIAQKHQMQVEELLRLNHIDEEKAKRLRPGDRLRIK